MDTKFNLGIQFYNPHIGRIKTIFAQNGPKFLDLCAGIYGNLFYRVDTLIEGEKGKNR